MNWLMPAAFLLAQIVGGEFIYTVQSGDSLTSVGARFGAEARVIAESNGLALTAWLMPEQTLRIDNRHIVPETTGGQVVINLPQRMLFYFDQGQLFRHYPLAVGRPGWRTPTGDFRILSMEENPVWDVPVSIQEEMRKQGKRVLTKVPPGPDNPLGKYWIGLSLPGIGIHGTIDPSSIYSFRTHGCIRLQKDDIRDLFSLARVGMKGSVTYERVLMAVVGDSVYVEVHSDPYRRGKEPLPYLQDLAFARGLSGMLDWTFVKEVIRKHDGIARDVTRR